MMDRSSTAPSLPGVPFLFAFAERAPIMELDGFFDDARDMWMIPTTEKIVPMVLSDSTTIATRTSTRVRDEGTDQD